MAKNDLTKDQERLAKLWDAYESQEKELELAMKNIANLESKLKEMNRVNSVLKKAVDDRDKEIRDLELKVIGLEEDNNKYQPRINELERLYKEEKERYAKLFAITEELEDDLNKAKSEIDIKDSWFDKNVGMLENIRSSIIERNARLSKMSQSKKETSVSSDLEKFKAEVSTQPGPIESVEANTEIKNETKTETKTETIDSENIVKPADEKITFKTVDVPKEEPKPDKIEHKEPEVTPEPTKYDIINKFTQIPDVTTEIAEKLYNSGFTTMDKLKNGTTEDIAQIDGISPTLARKIRTSVIEM